MKRIPAFYFERKKLDKIADELGPGFRSAEPFPHGVIEPFVPPEILDLVVEEFPGPTDAEWTLWGPGASEHSRDLKIEKLGTSEEAAFGDFTRHFIAQLNSATFLAFLERLTGIDGVRALRAILNNRRAEEGSKGPNRP